MSELFGLIQRATLWLSNKPNRLRLRGSRIEVIAAVLTRKPFPSILLARTAGYGGTWTLPQEGVGLKETFDDALYRCLVVECGFDRPQSRDQLERNLYLRSHRYLGLLDLPPVRHGERPVADDAVGTILESVKLKRKAYWVSTVLVASQDQVTFRPDGNELGELRWYEIERAADRLRECNRPEKSELLARAIQEAARHL
jgi:hypothetical protein